MLQSRVRESERVEDQHNGIASKPILEVAVTRLGIHRRT